MLQSHALKRFGLIFIISYVIGIILSALQIDFIPLRNKSLLLASDAHPMPILLFILESLPYALMIASLLFYGIFYFTGSSYKNSLLDGKTPRIMVLIFMLIIYGGYFFAYEVILPNAYEDKVNASFSQLLNTNKQNEAKKQDELIFSKEDKDILKTILSKIFTHDFKEENLNLFQTLSVKFYKSPLVKHFEDWCLRFIELEKTQLKKARESIPNFDTIYVQFLNQDYRSVIFRLTSLEKVNSSARYFYDEAVYRRQIKEDINWTPANVELSILNTLQSMLGNLSHDPLNYYIIAVQAYQVFPEASFLKEEVNSLKKQNEAVLSQEINHSSFIKRNLMYYSKTLSYVNSANPQYKLDLKNVVILFERLADHQHFTILSKVYLFPESYEDKIYYIHQLLINKDTQSSLDKAQIKFEIKSSKDMSLLPKEVVNILTEGELTLSSPWNTDQVVNMNDVVMFNHASSLYKLFMANQSTSKIDFRSSFVNRILSEKATFYLLPFLLNLALILLAPLYRARHEKPLPLFISIPLGFVAACLSSYLMYIFLHFLSEIFKYT